MLCMIEVVYSDHMTYFVLRHDTSLAEAVKNDLAYQDRIGSIVETGKNGRLWHRQINT